MVFRPSGFVTRTKGKSSFGGLSPLQELPIEYATSSTGGQNILLYPSGISVINCSSAASFFTLGIPEPGTYKTIVISTLSSHAAVRTNSTGAGGVYVDSTTATMWAPSTTVPGIMTWHLLAISSILWVTVGNSTVGSTAGWGTSS